MDNMHPMMQLLLLAMICFVFLSAFFFLSMYLVRPLFGITTIDVVMQNAIANPDAVAMNSNQANALKFLQFAQTIGTFLVPALLFAKLKFPDGDYLRLNVKTNFLLVVLGILILMAAIPFIDLTYYLNQKLALPSFLSNIEKIINGEEKDQDNLIQLF